MRTLMKVQLPSDPSDTTPMSVRFERIRPLLESLKPEAMYFLPDDGVRTMLIVFDMKSPADLPPIAEPLFRTGARLTFTPVMDMADVLAGIQKAEAGLGV
jgi:hypothetical protein